MAASSKEKLENQDSMHWIKPAVILAAGRVRRAGTGICASSHGSCFQGLKKLKKAIPVLPSENQASQKAAEHQIWVKNVHSLSFLIEEPKLCTNTHKLRYQTLLKPRF